MLLFHATKKRAQSRQQLRGTLAVSLRMLQRNSGQDPKATTLLRHLRKHSCPLPASKSHDNERTAGRGDRVRKKVLAENLRNEAMHLCRAHDLKYPKSASLSR